MTTPGNAMDAGPWLRDALLARLAERRAEHPALGAVWEGLAGEVQRHRVLADGVMAGQCAQCPDGGHVEDGVCLFLRRWCRVLGVGTEPTCTCPADHCLCGDCAFCTSRPATECCPAMPCDWNVPEKCPVHAPPASPETPAPGDEPVEIVDVNDPERGLVATLREQQPQDPPPVPGEGVAP